MTNFYTFQLISPLGGTLHYFLADGTLYPDAPPKFAHLLKNHAHVQLKVKSTESVWGLVRGGMCSSGQRSQ